MDSCASERYLLCPWTENTLMKQDISWPRFMLCRNDWLRPLLSSGFACLIPVFCLVFPLSKWKKYWSQWFSKNIVPTTLTSRSLLFFYQPSPSKTHDTTSALWVQQRTKPTVSSRGQTFIIWLYIANLLNYFCCVTTTSLSPLWLLYSQCCFLKQELWGKVV